MKTLLLLSLVLLAVVAGQATPADSPVAVMGQSGAGNACRSANWECGRTSSRRDGTRPITERARRANAPMGERDPQTRIMGRSAALERSVEAARSAETG